MAKKVFEVVVALTFLANTSRVLSNCSDRAIGVENNFIIPNSSFTASSYYDLRYVPYNGRLNGNNGWGPRDKGPDEYLQIDLEYPYIICAIATQGRSSGNEWVKKYKMKTSVDGRSWVDYQENGRVKIFTGNSDGNSIVKHVTTKYLARYIKFIPTDYKIWKTMRVGLYGHIEDCDNLPLGMESSVIEDGSIEASSAPQLARNARLHYASGSPWCASSSDSNPYLQIDMGTPHLICAVAIQGNNNADQWVKTYQIQTSINGSTWNTFQENNTDMIFSGNFDRSTVVRQVLYHSIVKRYIRIVPKTYHGAACLRAEIYGYQMNQTCSSHSVGIPSPRIVPNHRFTATSYYNDRHMPYMVRLGAKYTWGPRTKYAKDYFQVDLGHMFYVCGVATQGNGYGLYEWVTHYEVLYSINNNQWKTYMENGTKKEFQGNKDSATIASNSISDVFKAKFIRVFPTKFNKWKSIRVDFKGLPAGCVSSFGVEDSQIPDSQMTSSSSSDNSHSASHGRLYGGSSWCSLTNSNTEYLQVDLGQAKTVTGIATQGDKSTAKWVTSYKVSHSFDKNSWNEYKERQDAKEFQGNTNNSGVIVNWLNHPIIARYVRIFPQASTGRPCLRLDLYGCRYYVPHRVTNQATPDKRSVILRWNNIQTNYGTANYFVIVLTSITGSSMNATVNSTLNSHRVTNLKPFTKYEAKINGIQTNGQPLWEITNVFTTRAAVPEGIPTIMLTSVSSQAINISIKFTQTELLNGPMAGFTISYAPVGQEQQKVFVRNVAKATLKNLKKYTIYSITASVRNTLGDGPASNTIQTRTLEDVPETAPKNMQAKKINEQTFRVTWEPLTTEQANGVVTKYEIIWHYSLSSSGASAPSQELFKKTTQKSEFTMHNLKPYANYIVNVRGYTKIGPGPTSNVNFTTGHMSGLDNTSSRLCASEGDKVTLRCKTSKDDGSIPYTWTKNGYPLDGTPSATAKENILYLTQINDKDFGTYECTAKNKEGKVTFMISRFEVEKCQVPHLIQNQTKVIEYVVPLAVVIVLLLILSVFLIWRLRKTKPIPQQEVNVGNMDASDNNGNQRKGQVEPSTQLRTYLNAASDSRDPIQHKGDPIQLNEINKPMYEPLDEASRMARENTTPWSQESNPGGQQYEELNEVKKSVYEKLNPRTENPGNYEFMNVGYNNEAMSNSEV